MVANTRYIGDAKYMEDALHSARSVLPAAAATTYSGANSVSLADLRTTFKGSVEADCELEIFVGDMSVANLVNADTLKISVCVDTVSPIDASSIVWMLDIIDLLGAGGVGDKGETVRIRIPSSEIRINIAGTTTQYDIIGWKAVHTGTGVCSTATANNDGYGYTRLVF